MEANVHVYAGSKESEGQAGWADEGEGHVRQAGTEDEGQAGRGVARGEDDTAWQAWQAES